MFSPPRVFRGRHDARDACVASAPLSVLALSGRRTLSRARAAGLRSRWNRGGIPKRKVADLIGDGSERQPRDAAELSLAELSLAKLSLAKLSLAKLSLAKPSLTGGKTGIDSAGVR
jgi:hypothetical protein